MCTNCTTVIFFIIVTFCLVLETEFRAVTARSCPKEKHRKLEENYVTNSRDHELTQRQQITVDQSGRGDYSTIQDAIDAVPSSNMGQVLIRVEPGLYEEQVLVPINKPFIILRGRRAKDTIISYSHGGDIYNSSTFTVLASDFVAQSLTIQNTHGKDEKAVALRVSGDRAAFYDCNILSYQDTLLDDMGRHYYKDCYIEGATDFIFGNGASLFESCHVHSISPGGASITAQKRMTPEEKTGFYFVRSRVTGEETTFLGRPWGAYSRVVFAYTYMSPAVLPLGWNDWGQPDRQWTSYYGEYKNYGPGADTLSRVAWSHQLTYTQALPYLTMNSIDGENWIEF